MAAASVSRNARRNRFSLVAASLGDSTGVGRGAQRRSRLSWNASACDTRARYRPLHRAGGHGTTHRCVSGHHVRPAHWRTAPDGLVAAVYDLPRSRRHSRPREKRVRPARRVEPRNPRRLGMTRPDVVPVERALPNSPLAKEQAGIDACVHCGFCLQACPTYLTLEDENDSPRGRIVLMRALLEGTLLPESESVETHIARCLGCRACETVCPSGVPYGHLLEATRATLAERRPIPFLARMILGTFERPWLMRLAMFGGRVARATGISRLLEKLPGRIGFSMAMLSSTRRDAQSPKPTPASNGFRGTLALLTGCVMEGLFADANRATERVLLANDYSLTTAPNQGCCGALHAHAGDADAARRLARANIAAFERDDIKFVGVNAAGCGAMMEEYPT